MISSTFVFFLALSLAAWHLKRDITFRLSVSFLLFSSLIIVNGIALLIYLFYTGPTGIDTHIYDTAMRIGGQNEVVRRLLWAMTLMFVCLTTGSLLSRITFAKWYRSGRRAGITPATQTISRAYRIGPVGYVLLWYLALFMFGVSVWSNQLFKVYQYFASGGTEFYKILLRNTEGGTGIYLYNVVLYSIAPFLVMVCYNAWKGSPKTRSLRLLTVVLFGLVLLGKFGTLSKAPPVIFLLQIFLMHHLLLRKKFNFHAILWTLWISMVLFVGIVKATMPNLEMSAVFSFLYYRIFDIPNEVLLEYFSAIPAYLPYGWGAGIFGFLAHDGGQSHLETYFAVAQLVHGFGLTSSSSNAMFIGDAWAEFSWGGVAFFSMLAGFWVRAIDLYAFRNGFTDETACIIAGCAFGVFTMLSTALNTALITGGLAFIPFLSMYFTRRRKSNLVPTMSTELLPNNTI